MSKSSVSNENVFQANNRCSTPSLSALKSTSSRPSRPLQRSQSRSSLRKTPSNPPSKRSTSHPPPRSAPHPKPVSCALPPKPKSRPWTRNLFFDDRYNDKQEVALTRILNYILTEESCDRIGILRKKANGILGSENMKQLFQTIDLEVDEGRLSLQGDLNLAFDLGARGRFVELFVRAYNPHWLHFGLESVWGEVIHIPATAPAGTTPGCASVPLTEENDPSQLSVRVHSAVCKYMSECVLPSQGLRTNLQALPAYRTFLKRLLVLILFLDTARTHNLLPNQRCLFLTTSEIKSSQHMLAAFSKHLMQGEGDTVRHLHFLGYDLAYTQTSLDEHPLRITNLAVDLRDGVRLARLVEYMSKTEGVAQTLRLPALTPQQKQHNIQQTLTALTHTHHLSLGTITAKDIQMGHRQKTLSFLWKMIMHFKVPGLVDVDMVRREIERIRAMKCGGGGGECEERQEEDDAMKTDQPNLYMDSPALQTLLTWAHEICSIFSTPILNFTSSFTDGRALCLLIHFYHPHLLRLDEIATPPVCSTALELLGFDEEEVNSDVLMTDVIMKAKRIDVEGYAKRNLKLAKRKAQMLGGIPEILREADLINTLPSEKAVSTYIAYLCSRLIYLHQETHRQQASILILQRALRSYQAKQALRKLRAAVCIQRHARGWLARKWVRETRAACLIQRCWRRCVCVRRARRVERGVLKAQSLWRARVQHMRYALLRKSAVTCQRRVRTRIARARYLKYRSQVILVQSVVRSYLQRTKFIREQAAHIIQAAYRTHREARRNHAAMRVQARWRGYHARQHVGCVQEMRRACVCVQSAWRGKVRRERYESMRNAAIRIQSLLRGHLTRKHLTQHRAASIIQHACHAYQHRQQAQRECHAATQVQSTWKRYVVQRHYGELKRGCVCLQKWVRGWLARRRYEGMKHAALVIQHATRSYLARKALALLRSAVLIQSHIRGYLTRLHTRQHLAATRIQTAYRRHLCLRHARAACTIQSAWRRHVCRREYLRVVRAVVCVQCCVRGRRERRRYGEMKRAAVLIQSHTRARFARLALARNLAARTIQSFIRGHLMRQHITQHRSASRIQRAYRRYHTHTQFMHKWNACVTLQAVWRGVSQKQRYEDVRRCVVRCQSWVRGKQAKTRYERMRNAALVVQSACRAHTARKHLTHLRSIALLQRVTRGFLARLHTRQLRAALTIQRFYRHTQLRRTSLVKLTAAKTLQKWVRGTFARRRYESMRRAAFTLQAHWRGKVQRMRYRQMQRCAVTLQSWVRGVHARSEIQKLHKAAALIQSRFRRHIQYTHYTRTRRATLLCQSLIRRSLAMKSYTRTQQAVLTLQCFTRVCLAKRALTRERACVTMQSVVRGYLVRCLVRRMKAALCVQRAWRGYWQKVTTQRRAATMIQSHWRGHLARCDYSRQQRAALVLQTHTRGFLARRHADQMRQAAIPSALASSLFTDIFTQAFTVIDQNESHRLALLHQQRCHERLTAIRQNLATFVIQRFMKGWIRKHRAAVVLQTSWRRHYARCHFLEQRAATLLLSRFRDARLPARPLEILLHSTQLPLLMKAVIVLEGVTQRSDLWCQRIARLNGIPALFNLMESLNRSEPHIELMKHSLGILEHLARCPQTVDRLFHAESDACVALLVNILQMLRERHELGGRIIGVMTQLVRDAPHRVARLRAMPEVLKKLQSLHHVLSRKLQMDRRAHKLPPVSKTQTRGGAKKPVKQATVGSTTEALGRLLSLLGFPQMK